MTARLSRSHGGASKRKDQGKSATRDFPTLHKQKHKRKAKKTKENQVI